jgi:hypothetical protein
MEGHVWHLLTVAEQRYDYTTKPIDDRGIRYDRHD